MDIILEIAAASDTTDREAHEVAAMLRAAIERLGAVSNVASINVVAPDGAKGSAVASLQEFLISIAPTGLKALFSTVKAIATRPRQPQTKIIVKTKSSQFTFEFDPSTLSLEDIVENVSKLPSV